MRGDGEICSVAAGGICEKQMGGRGIGEEQDPTHLDQLDQLRSEGIALAAGIWTELMSRNYAFWLNDQP